MLVNIIQNTISSFRSALAAASVITTNLKMWLGFETSETLGREEVVNGDFSDGTNNWTTSNSTISIEGGALKITSTGGNRPQANQTVIGLNIGSQYKLSAVAKRGTTSNDVEIEISGIASTSTSNRNTTTEYETIFYIFTATATSHIIQAKIDEASELLGTTAYFSNISLKELTQITPDKSGNNNVGELFTGKALEFDGSTTYVSANSFAGTLSNNTAFTFAVWFNSEKTLPARFFSNILISSGGLNQETNIFKIGVNPRDSADAKSDGTVINIGGIYFDDSSGYNNVVPLSGGVNYNDGQWHRLVVSRPAGSGDQDLSFYVDGSLIGTADCNPFWNNILKFDFGQEWDQAGTSDHFEGNMSDIQVYDYAWDTDDVTYDYANPNKLAIDNPSTDLVVTNLKAYWAMSEGAGLVAYDSGTNLEEEEVVDGNFPTGTTAWTLSTGWAIGNNKLNGTSAITENSQTIFASSSSRMLKITYDVVVDSGEVAVYMTDKSKDWISQSGSYTDYVTSSSTVIEIDGRNSLAFTGSVTNISVREVTASDHGALLFGVDHVDAQPRIPQLGMQNWAKSTPVADEITLIPNPTIPTQDILGNAVRDRLNSFNLDGSGYAVVADDTDLDFGTGDFTLECWLRIDGNTLRRLLDKRNNTSGYTLYLTDLNVLNLELNDGTGNSGFVLTSSLSSNTWLHLAIVCDRSANATCYINKAAETPVPISSKGGNIDSTSSLFIGADAPDGLSYYSTDIISDVRLYDRVLTSDEVENNYNAGLSAHTN